MKTNLLIIIFILVIVLCMGCDVNQTDEKSLYYFLNGQGSTELFRLNTIIAVIFEDDTNPTQADSLVSLYKLVPIKMFGSDSYKVDWEIEDIVLMKLPEGEKIENYLSKFPRRSNQKFGDLPEVKFCLPVFAFDNSGDPRSRFIINERVAVSSGTDSINTMKILEPYKLNLIEKNAWSEYRFELTHNSPANSLEISNMLYSYSEFNWSMPGCYAYISFGFK